MLGTLGLCIFLYNASKMRLSLAVNYVGALWHSSFIGNGFLALKQVKWWGFYPTAKSEVRLNNIEWKVRWKTKQLEHDYKALA